VICEVCDCEVICVLEVYRKVNLYKFYTGFLFFESTLILALFQIFCYEISKELENGKNC